MKDMRKEVQDVKFMLSIMMDHYREGAELARPAIGAVKKKQEALLELLIKLTQLLDQNSIPYWLDYGTLLGAVRHQGFVPWDDDLDLGVFDRDRKVISELIKDNFDDTYSIYESGEHDKFLKFEKYYGINRVSIDLFTYMNNNVVLKGEFYPKDIVYNKPFPEEAILPFRKLPFEGQEFNIPNEYHLYLKKNYGEYMSLPKNSHYWPHEKWNSHYDYYPE
jgi:phosphorylcholine metabolism protein LicD